MPIALYPCPSRYLLLNPPSEQALEVKSDTWKDAASTWMSILELRRKIGVERGIAVIDCIAGDQKVRSTTLLPDAPRSQSVSTDSVALFRSLGARRARRRQGTLRHRGRRAGRHPGALLDRTRPLLSSCDRNSD